jgi:hypothetical protein
VPAPAAVKTSSALGHLSAVDVPTFSVTGPALKNPENETSAAASFQLSRSPTTTPTTTTYNNNHNNNSRSSRANNGSTNSVVIHHQKALYSEPQTGQSFHRGHGVIGSLRSMRKDFDGDTESRDRELKLDMPKFPERTR